jgi:adenylosuccinate synthase
MVIGLGFGDEGKGTVVDHLVATAHRLPLVVRFSGGAQAAHNVVTEAGVQHTFSQFGSGTLRSAPTLLSRHVLVDPLRLYEEGKALSTILGRNALELVLVDGRAPLVTRVHQAVNHARERARGEGRHGSTGLGMGETELYRLLEPQDHPVIGDLERPQELTRKVNRLYAWAESQVGELPISLDAVLSELQAFGEDRLLTIASPQQVRHTLWEAPELIFEGSQGVLLDEWVGFHPHTTWSTITPDNGLALLREAGLPTAVEKIGVTRTYTTRHGAGPFPTEASTLSFAEAHNAYGEFQGAWRVGHLDLPLLRYAAQAIRPDSLAITHMDVEQTQVAVAYDSLLDFAGNVSHAMDKEWQVGFTDTLMAARPLLTPVENNRAVRTLIEEVTGAEARILSYGPEASAKVSL